MRTQRLSRTRKVVYSLLIIFIFALGGLPARAASLPAGFTEALVAGGLSSPTAMQFAPDGRLFVCEQGGRLRVIRDGMLLPTPFLTLTVSSVGERGLLGVAFDPSFSTNQYVYVYYTATTPTVHNRISRFTANGDVAVAGSELAIFDLDNLSGATNHNGGALNFGQDGKLYAAVGENANSANSQSMNTVLGKMLRLNTDGTIPTDNPFYLSVSGKNRAIWALGLRNPFTFSFRPFGTELFINDVGENTWEEINDGLAGANYGWPTTEGPTTNPAFTSPRYAYAHAGGTCAITGGTFYSPLTNRFPSTYVNDYFFADFCAGWIRELDPAAGNSVTTFATGISAPVDLKVSDDGSLYYLARGTGATTGVVFRIDYGNPAPSITTHPASQTVAAGAPVTFSVRASGPPPLRYQWQRNGADISGATAEDYTIAASQQSDNGARFRAMVANDFGSVFSNEAVLTVAANQPPTATISQPAAGALYSGGSVINYAGTGTDPEDGTLPPGAFTWWVDFHHDTHTHPFILPTTGASGGSFTIPTAGETSANVWYRLYLMVRDAGGLTHTTQRDILPRTVRLTLATNPAGLQVRLDGQPAATPVSFDGVVGIVRTLEAPTPQAAGGTTYEFVSWSDGGAGLHNISTPATNTTYTATYRVSGSSGTPTPYRGIPIAIPGVLQAEEFDEGGEGLAYHDVTAGNSGGQFRSTDVDIEATSDIGGGYNVGWMRAGEWLAYSIDVAGAGVYTLDARVAANGPGGTFHVEVNGANVTGPLTIPNTGAWQNWVTLSKAGVSVPAGRQMLRIVLDTQGPTGVFGNVNYLRLTTTPGSSSPPEVVIYANDIPTAALHGAWTFVTDSTSPNGIELATPDNGVSNTSQPLAAPSHYVDVTFNADSGTPYSVWLRLKALNNSKYNDAVWVQFSDATLNGSPIYPINTTSGLLVNLATDAGAASLNGWGWQHGAYWLSQATTLTFSTSGSHTMRVQVREDGVQFDQIVLSPRTYLNAPPGPVGNDATIVPKPSP